jgi:hypothetical protein
MKEVARPGGTRTPDLLVPHILERERDALIATDNNAAPAQV